MVYRFTINVAIECTDAVAGVKWSIALADPLMRMLRHASICVFSDGPPEFLE